MVHFDEGDILLKEWTFRKTTDELLYQLKHDEAMGRMWAVDELQKRLHDPAVHSALVETGRRKKINLTPLSCWSPN